MNNFIRENDNLDWVFTTGIGSDILPGAAGSDVEFIIHPYEKVLSDISSNIEKPIKITIPMRYLENKEDRSYIVTNYEKQTRKISMSPLSADGNTVPATRIKIKIPTGEVFKTDVGLIE